MARRKSKKSDASAGLLPSLAAGESVAMPDRMELVPVNDLIPYERNARIHPAEQIRALQASIRERGFLVPLLIDAHRQVIAGHGRLLAAKALGMEIVPCVFAEHLTEEQRRSYMLADNRLAEMSGWDMDTVRVELQELKSKGVDIGVTGFTLAELPAVKLDGPGSVKEASTRSEKLVTCPECGCQFRPARRKR